MFQHAPASGSLPGSTIGGYVWPVIWRRDLDGTVVAQVLNTQLVEDIANALDIDTKHWAVTFYYSTSADLPPVGRWLPWFTVEHLGSRARLTKKDCDFRQQRSLPTRVNNNYPPKYFSEFTDLDAFRSKCQQIDAVYNLWTNNCQHVVNSIIYAFYN